MAMMWRIFVAALVFGNLGCDTEAEKQRQALKAEKQRQEREAELIEKQQQEQAFVAEVGRSPSLGKMDDAGKNDLHIVAQLKHYQRPETGYACPAIIA